MGKSSRVATRFGASSSGDAFCKDLPRFRVISISIFFFSSVHELFLEKEDEELGERRREKERVGVRVNHVLPFRAKSVLGNICSSQPVPLKRQLTSQLNTTIHLVFSLNDRIIIHHMMTLLYYLMMVGLIEPSLDLIIH